MEATVGYDDGVHSLCLCDVFYPNPPGPGARDTEDIETNAKYRIRITVEMNKEKSTEKDDSARGS